MFSALEIFLVMRYINLLFTYLLTYYSVYSSTQRPTLPSRPSIRSFTWQGLETSSWPSSCSLRNDTGFCPCQPLETDRPSYGPWWSDATVQAGYAMTTTTTPSPR